MILLLWVPAYATAPLGQPEVDTPDTSDVFQHLEDAGCPQVREFAYGAIPRYVYADQPDSLYQMVLYWEYRCVKTELMVRILILGAIWDDQLDESLYTSKMIVYLMDRYDPAKLDDRSDARLGYDKFTTDFANQLLPHVEPGSLEQFFCLYYAGLPDDAWALLQSEALEDTWLRFYYDERVEMVETQDRAILVTATAGAWIPLGDFSFVGDHPLFGLMVEQRGPMWFGRLLAEARVGRTDRPYFVRDGDVYGYSDRFDAIYLGIEGGLTAWRSDRHHVDVFAGIGYDGIKPFWEEDVTLGTVNLNLGVGYRAYLGSTRKWYLDSAGRWEWVGERSTPQDELSGQAWSVRLGVGYAFNSGKKRQKELLGQ